MYKSFAGDIPNFTIDNLSNLTISIYVHGTKFDNRKTNPTFINSFIVNNVGRYPKN